MYGVKTRLGLAALAAGFAATFAFGASAETLKYNDHDPLGGMRPNFLK